MFDMIYSLFSYSFFRKGKAGSYCDEMSPEYIQKFNDLEQQQSWLN